MQFHEIINAKLSAEADRPVMQKDAFPVSSQLRQYLKNHGRDTDLPLSYTDLLYYSHANALRDNAGKLTHWETAIYNDDVRHQLHHSLRKLYGILKKESNASLNENIEIERIDFCEFGNSVPFRVRVLHKKTGLTDRYYIKMADASRIYGLELEHLLSPNPVNFLCHGNTLVEEHIQGTPGDIFLKNMPHLPQEDKIVLAKEFVQFNERCFIRLLGDMRSYNFAVQVTRTNDNVHYRIRAIDFDQQSYEGKKNLYMPQFYGENLPLVNAVLKDLEPIKIKQYQQEERKAMASKMYQNRKQVIALLDCIKEDEISEHYKVLLLRKELNEHFNTTYFSTCRTMGAILKKQLKFTLQKYLAGYKRV